MVSLISPAGYAIMRDIGRMPFGHIWQWSGATIVIYLGFTVSILLGANLHRLRNSLFIGYLLSLIIPDPTGAMLFAIVYGGMFALAAHWPNE